MRLSKFGDPKILKSLTVKPQLRYRLPMQLQLQRNLSAESASLHCILWSHKRMQLQSGGVRGIPGGMVIVTKSKSLLNCFGYC